MNDNEIEKAFDILDKFEFFGGQRAGRELWFDKPTDIQNEDIGDFLRDLDFLKQFINRQKAEIEMLESEIDKQYEQAKADILGNMADGGTSCHWCMEQHKAEAIKEFAERLKKRLSRKYTIYGREYVLRHIREVVKEMTEVNYED